MGKEVTRLKTGPEHFSKTLTLICPQILNHYIKNCTQSKSDSGAKHLTSATEALNPRNNYFPCSRFKKLNVS